MTAPRQQERPWADVPALDRMREDLAAVAARDARAPVRRRPPRLRIGLALAAVLAVVTAGIALVAAPGDEAVLLPPLVTVVARRAG